MGAQAQAGEEGLGRGTVKCQGQGQSVTGKGLAAIEDKAGVGL